MKPILSFIVSVVFLLQTFVTVQAMPINKGKAKITCKIEKQVVKKHTCCSLLAKEKQQTEKKNCCSGTFKMSCCVHVIAVTPSLEQITFLPIIYQKSFFGYLESTSSFDADIFHPPLFL